jgi:ATP-dependent RNA helicase UAP56/SUB2
MPDSTSNKETERVKAEGADKNSAVYKESIAQAADTYLHRVGRAGRFGTKGIAISFVSSERDMDVLKAIEARFDKKVDEYPEEGVQLQDGE